MGIRRLAGWLLRGALTYAVLCLGLTLGSVALTTDCTVVEQDYDIAVVLGGGPERFQDVIDDRLGRIHAAIRLYDRGKVAHLVLSGGGPVGPASTAMTMAEIARGENVPGTALTLESRSLSTLQNALYSRPALPPDASLLIVTERYHAWRSWASFAWAGRPGDVCAAQSPGRDAAQKAKILRREIAAWGFNILRASVWSIGRFLGLGERMPDSMLA